MLAVFRVQLLSASVTSETMFSRERSVHLSSLHIGLFSFVNGGGRRAEALESRDTRLSDFVTDIEQPAINLSIMTATGEETIYVGHET